MGERMLDSGEKIALAPQQGKMRNFHTPQFVFIKALFFYFNQKMAVKYTYAWK